MSLAQDPSSTESFAFFRRAEHQLPTPVPGLVAGKIVGDFRLVALVGQGGMGQVWEAEQVSLGRRTVAVKFMRPERVTPHQLELSARAARAGGRLSHPAIVGVHGHGESEGLAWIAMELVSGAWTLRDFLDEISRVDEVPAGYDRHVVRFAAEIADGLQAAHEASVIHRDLKPQNILVTPDDHPKVTDFGLARLTDEGALSHTGDFAGTYYYMSPEQVAGKRAGLDHRTDIFSLGILLYEMLALRRPFDGDTSHQIAAQILAKDPPDPRTLRSRIPHDLVVIVGKALEKDRDKRYATMKDFAADLRRWLADEPIHATPPTLLDRALKWTKRNPTKSVAAGLASAALVVISALLVKNVQANRDLLVERESLARANDSLEASEAEALANARAAKANEERAIAGERHAQEEKDRADREADAAKRKAEEVLRLSAVQELDDLVEEADRLWPAHPENIARYESWIERARKLSRDLPQHMEQRAELRSRALPRTEAERLAERESHPEFARWQELTAALVRRDDDVLARAAAAKNERTAENDPARMDAELARLDLLLDERRDWHFADEDREARWWNNQLSKLIEGIRELEADLLAEDGTSEAHGWSIPKRLAFAAWIAQRSVSGAEANARWSKALSSIADPSQCPAYGGLVLSPQMGLLPIGRDPQSGLWEFAHLQTGDVPQRTADGELATTESTGLVFVFVPGGRFAMGAQKGDPNAPNYDKAAENDESPVREVTLSPFFLSKYEMTQGQWSRFTGQNPSFNTPATRELSISLLNPVERVSWNDCKTVMDRLGLSLPSEAQWEYGARGGRTSAWWTGAERESLIEAANFADRSAGLPWGDENWPDDGYPAHAPVNEYLPNPFGLFHVHGNVSELCYDGKDDDFYEQGPTRDPVSDPVGSSPRVIRGGSFYHSAQFARSGNRLGSTPENAGYDTGVRPARLITP